MKDSIKELHELRAILSEWEYEDKYVNAVHKSIRAIETLQMTENDIEWQIQQLRGDESVEAKAKREAFEAMLLIVSRAWTYYNEH